MAIVTRRKKRRRIPVKAQEEKGQRVPAQEKRQEESKSGGLTDSMIDETIAESFPASDPPSWLSELDPRISLVRGGRERGDSVRAALQAIPADVDGVLIHDAARPLVTDALITRTVEAAFDAGAAIAALRASDTVKRADAAGCIAETLPRDEIFLAQTPQAFRVDVLRDALKMADDATDEAALAERAGHPVKLVDGDPRNLKITTPGDLTFAEGLLGGPSAATSLRIGNGYDLHRLVDGRPLVLGGVVVPFEKGLLGHSDADVVCHAITDAILGAAGAGDIGRHFPDTDPVWKDAVSLDLLRRAVAIVAAAGFSVVNVDVVVVAQRPKLAPHADAVRARVADALGCDPSHVSVKGKTNEGVDSIGAGESIAAYAVALLVRSST